MRLKKRIREHLKKVYLKITSTFDRAVMPRSIVLEVTHRCNLSCSMCLRDSIPVGKQDLSLDNFRHILKEIPGLKTIGLMGIGETLMNPDFYEMFNYSSLLGKRMSITTNGTLLTEMNMEKLKGIQTIVVSVDTPHPEKYREIRGFDLEKVKNNLKCIKKISKETELIIQSVLMRDNVGDLKGLIELAREVGANQLNLLHLLAADERHSNSHAHNLSDLDRYLNESAELAASYGIILNSRPAHPEFKVCTLAWNGPFITMSGDVYPCCFIKRAPVDDIEEWYMHTGITVPISNYIMGNIFTTSFKEIWNNDKFRKLRRNIIESRKEFKGSTLSPAEFNLIRKKHKIEDVSYCRVCLYQWMCAC